MSHLPLPMLENYREICGVTIFFMKDHRSAQAVSNVKIYCHADLAIKEYNIFCTEPSSSHVLLNWKSPPRR